MFESVGKNVLEKFGKKLHYRICVIWTLSMNTIAPVTAICFKLTTIFRDERVLVKVWNVKKDDFDISHEYHLIANRIRLYNNWI